MKMSVKLHKALLRSMMWTFPFSSYLWAVGTFAVGVLYIFSPSVYPPADIPLVPDFLWGSALTGAAMAIVHFQRREWGKWVEILSFVISMMAFWLFIASMIDHRPVSAIASGLTSIYYSYSYLTAKMIPEMRAVRDSRKAALLEELDRRS